MLNIRVMTRDDEEEVINMMRIFYDSPAILHTSSDAVLKRDIEACVSDMPLIEGFIFENEAGEIVGYAMASKNYTTEYGGICIWVEDLYLKEGYREGGFSVHFFEYLEKRYPEAVRYKLEVEAENARAVAAYKKNGYAISDYLLMTKEMDDDKA